MKRKKFRIIRIIRDDSALFDTRIKTWFGWVSFSVFYKTFLLHVFSDPVTTKELAYERIYEYCRAKGYNISNITITEAEK